MSMLGNPQTMCRGQGCQKVTGFTSEEFAADPDLWLRLVHEDDRPLVLNMAQRVLIEDQPIILHHQRAGSK
jgi:hypothetical protein